VNIFWETMRWVFRAGFPFNTCGLTEAPNQPSATEGSVPRSFSYQRSARPLRFSSEVTRFPTEAE